MEIKKDDYASYHCKMGFGGLVNRRKDPSLELSTVISKGWGYKFPFQVPWVVKQQSQTKDHK